MKPVVVDPYHGNVYGLNEIESVWEPPSEVAAEPTEWLGVDIGYVYPAADSDGQIYRWTSSKDRHRWGRYHVEAGPVTVKRLDGTVVEQPAYSEDQIADVFARASLNDDGIKAKQLASVIVAKARKSNRGVVLEDWEDFQRRKASWIRLYRSIRSRAEKTGVAFRTVNRAYTSQTCPECGHISRGNRPARNDFHCVECGYQGQADVVAALNLRAKAAESMIDQPAQCSNPACSKAVWRANKCCACYFHQRRWGILPTVLRLERLQVAKNAAEFSRTLEKLGPSLKPTKSNSDPMAHGGGQPSSPFDEDFANIDRIEMDAYRRGYDPTRLTNGLD